MATPIYNNQSRNDYLAQFATPPEINDGYTMITAMHPVHGIETYYLSTDQWQGNIKSILTPFWINGYTVTMMPMD